MSEDLADLPSGFDVFTNPEVMRMLGHPVRARIFRAAVRRPISAKEFAAGVDQPVDRLSYHFRELAKAGLIKPVRRTRRRGATETHYRAVASLDLSEELERSAPAEVRQMLGRGVLGDITVDLEAALDRGASDERGFLLARGHFTVSAAGKDRLRDEVTAFYRRLEALEHELAAEAAASDDAEPPDEYNVVLGLYRGEGDELSSANSPFTWWRSDEDEDPLPLIGPPVEFPSDDRG